jgi:hypothetical protein
VHIRAEEFKLTIKQGREKAAALRPCLNANGLPREPMETI